MKKLSPVKVLTIVLAVMLIVSMLPATALAASGYGPSNGNYFTTVSPVLSGGTFSYNQGEIIAFDASAKTLLTTEVDAKTFCGLTSQSFDDAYDLVHSGSVDSAKFLKLGTATGTTSLSNCYARLDTTGVAPGNYRFWLIGIYRKYNTTPYYTYSNMFFYQDVVIKAGSQVVAVTGVELSAASKSLEVGKSFTLLATAQPADASNKAVSWKSSDTKVATVEDGKVKAKGKGTATITVTTKDGAKKASCAVTVGVKSATKVSLNKTKAALTKGKTLTLKATLSPKNANPETVTWKSSDTKIAKVSPKGVVTGMAVGTATITALSWNGKQATCKVTVNGASLSVTSSGISKGVIAKKYGMYGSQRSNGIPTRSIPLTIKNAPEGTVCYAVFMDDPDGGNWIHWMVANIATATIPENASISKASTMVQGKNDFGKTGYGGPTPPNKTHTYRITVYALKSKVSLYGGFSKSQFTSAIAGNVLAKATIKAKYIRK